MIIAFTGAAGSGKDTAAAFLSREYGFNKVSFATPLKSVCKTVFGLTDDEMSDRDLKEKELDRWPFISPRQLLQEVGTDLFRNHFEGVWLQAFVRAAKLHSHVVVSDLRFNDEAELIREMGGRVINIKPVGSPYVTDRSNHVSEQGIDPSFIDAEVINSFYETGGKRELFSKLSEMMSLLDIKPCWHCNYDYVPDAIR